MENINTVTEESQQRNHRLSGQNTTKRSKDNVSGLTSLTATTISFKENENIYLTGEITPRW